MNAEITAMAEVVTNGAQEMAGDVQTQAKEAASSMTLLARKVLLAGVGAMALTKDEVEEFVAKLVERGEIAEQDGRKLVKDVLSRRRGEAEAAAEKAEETTEKQVARFEAMLDQRIESILAHLNVPTKNDIDALSQKIALLTEKVDALKDA